MNKTPLKGKENKPDCIHAEDPVSMAQTIDNQNNTITHQANTIADLNDVALTLKNTVEALQKKINELERQLEHEKKLRLEDSDSSGSPPLVKK